MAILSDFVTRMGDDLIFYQEKALAYLLSERVVFVNSRPYVENPWADKHKQEIAGPTTVVFVNSNDVFAWGCADGECVTGSHIADDANELYRLLRYVLEDSRWGAVKYACWKNNLQPQKALVDKLKKAGVWDDWWQSLSPNPDQTK